MKLNIDYITEILNNEKIDPGLYIIATPIGNLADITLRSLNILSNVDFIFCEDTRVSKKLTSKYGIKRPMKSLHKFNTAKVLPEIIKKLKFSKSIAIISDSGTPIISDPGSELVRECVIEEIPVFSVPGPSATIASVIVSDFANSTFNFRGFFPRQTKDINKEIDYLRKSDSPIIYFESPKRILKSLNILYEKYGECRITFVRELTKKHEEVINKKLSLLIKILSSRKKIMGEITFIIKANKRKIKNTITDKKIIDMSNKLKSIGMNISEISKNISKEFDIPRRNVYQLLIKNKK